MHTYIEFKASHTHLSCRAVQHNHWVWTIVAFPQKTLQLSKLGTADMGKPVPQIIFNKFSPLSSDGGSCLIYVQCNLKVIQGEFCRIKTIRLQFIHMKTLRVCFKCTLSSIIQLQKSPRKLE